MRIVLRSHRRKVQRFPAAAFSGRAMLA